VERDKIVAQKQPRFYGVATRPFGIKTLINPNARVVTACDPFLVR